MGSAALRDHLEVFETGPAVPAPEAPVPPIELKTPQPELPQKPIAPAELQETAWQEGYEAARVNYEEKLLQAQTQAQERQTAESERTEAELSLIADRLIEACNDLQRTILQRVNEVCLPYLREVAQERCLDNFSEVIIALMKEDCAIEVYGPPGRLQAVRQKLSGAAINLCSFSEADTIEIHAKCNETRLDTRLGAWLDEITGGEHGSA